MAEDSLYLTTYETALAVVATSMKKARLSLDTLIINSFIGGVLFTAGGMLHVMVQAECPDIYSKNPGIIHLIQGVLYPIGLFYVVLMGVDLFNSNVLFFSVGVARGAVSIFDLLISWIVSWWINLAGTIFVCYIICDFSGATKSDLWIAGSVHVLEQKLEFNFVQTLLKAVCGNFFVCLAIYLQLMAKPIHVKLLMMVLPIFTFVSLGYTHSVADMFLIIIGLINGAPTTVRTVAWRLFLPGALGNIIGGAFFSLVIPFYLHIVVVERDRRKLNLPRFEMRDQQPELNQDSRVVRVTEHEEEEEEEAEEGSDGPKGEKVYPYRPELETASTGARSIASRRRHLYRSPSNVFPVYGMGRAGERERSVASGFDGKRDDESLSGQSSMSRRRSATFMGESLVRSFSRNQGRKDLEAQVPPELTRAPSDLSARQLFRPARQPSDDGAGPQPVTQRHRPSIAGSGMAPASIAEHSHENTSTEVSSINLKPTQQGGDSIDK